MVISNRVAGGIKAAEKNRQYNKDFYKIIGRKGGKISRGGGFIAGSDFARKMGQKGGQTRIEGLKTP